MGPNASYTSEGCGSAGLTPGLVTGISPSRSPMAQNIIIYTCVRENMAQFIIMLVLVLFVRLFPVPVLSTYDFPQEVLDERLTVIIDTDAWVQCEAKSRVVYRYQWFVPCVTLTAQVSSKNWQLSPFQ